MSQGVDIDAVHRVQPVHSGRGFFGLRGRRDEVRQWFRANPDELLTYSDMVVKFGITRQQAEACVTALRQEGTLCSAVMVGLNPGRLR